MGVSNMALLRQQVLFFRAAEYSDQEPRIIAAIGEPSQLDVAGFALTGEEAKIIAVKLLAAHFQGHVEPGRRAGEAGIGSGPDALAAGADAITHAPADAAIPGIV